MQACEQAVLLRGGAFARTSLASVFYQLYKDAPDFEDFLSDWKWKKHIRPQ